MRTLSPCLDTLPAAQRGLWPKLGPTIQDFVLYGGTALALQVGGRQSIDFDFFTPSVVSPEDLLARFSFLQGAVLIQRATSTASFLLNCPDPVKISFFGSLEIGRVDEPSVFADNGVVAAGLLDLAAQKVKVVQVRAESKDYIDLCTLISQGVSLAQALGAAQALYPGFNPMITLKALTFFNDGDLRTLERAYRDQLTAAVAGVAEIPATSKKSDSLLPSQSGILRDLGPFPPTKGNGKGLEREP